MASIRTIMVVIMSAVMVVQLATRADAAACSSILDRNTEYTDWPFVNVTVPGMEKCCSMCNGDARCGMWTYHAAPLSTCELHWWNNTINENSTCTNGNCIGGTKCPVGTKQQILDMALALVVTAENFSGACYIIEHSFPAVGMGFWLDSGAPAIMQTLLNINAVEYAAIAAGQRNISVNDGIKLATWMLTDLWKDVIILIPSFAVSLPLPVQSIIMDIAYNVGVAGLKRQFAQFMTCAAVADYTCMIHEMVNSKWYRDEPARATRDVQLLKRYPSLCNKAASYSVNGTTTAVRCDRRGVVPATTYTLSYR